MRPLPSVAALAGLAALGLTGCRTPPASASSAAPTAPAGEAAPAESLSMYEQRLLDAIESMGELDTAAAAAAEADRPDIERRFRGVANEFNSIVANNPDELEARLIYAKFLDRYGDRDGALEQFAEVLDRDPTVAVAHQQVGTYFAEEGEHAKALAYYLNAVANAPEESAYHYSVGELLYTFRPGFLADGIFDEARLDTAMLDAFRLAAQYAPDELAVQFRYGEAFYDVASPGWEAALAHWDGLAARADLSPLQADAVQLHRARCLGELERYAAARAALAGITAAGLESSKAALLAALDEAEQR